MGPNRARVYSYDRAGYRRSEPSPNPQYTAINRNRELATLLEVAEIEPPLLGDSTYHEIVGLDQKHVVSEGEYEVIKTDEKRILPTAQIEESYMAESAKGVNDALPEGCCILGDKRLSVIFANESVDLTMIYHHAVENNLGTEEARQQLAVRLEDMEQVDEHGQRAHLGLSRSSRFIYAEGKARRHTIC
ncbi:hypothetical protein AbraCBS73388_005467, partial [Aspergillus brasiliensis]